MTGSVWNGSALRAEADYFHRVLFGSPAPRPVTDQYLRLHAICFPLADPAEKMTAERVVRLGLDAEAIECAFRLRGRKHLLTRKMNALLYLVEVRREYYPLFFNDRTALVMGKLRLLMAIFSWMGKAIWGEFLIRRHGLD
jgi:hypothetical protein